MRPWLFTLFWLALVLALLMALAGADPQAAFTGFFKGAFGGKGFSYLMTTLSRASVIIGMALAALLAFRAGLVNIGGEGQLVVGGLVAAVVGIYCPGPGWLVLVAGVVLAMAAAALWAMLAGAMQIALGVPLLIGSLLLNYPARFIASYIVSHPLRDVASGLPQTFQVNKDTWLPLVSGTRLDAGALIMLGLLVAVLAYTGATTHGLRARLTGLSLSFARASGLPVNRLALQTLAMSGAVAGLVGALIVFGSQHRYTDGMLVQPLYAWTGIVAVLLVRLVPWQVPLSGLFFAALATGAAGMERSAGVPKEIALILQAVIILLVASQTSGIQLSAKPKGKDHA